VAIYDSKMNDFSKKRALVTGASAGIGYATTEALAGQGAQVYALARREKRLTELQEKWPEQIIPVVHDLREPIASLNSKLDFQNIDILINNAGLALGTDRIQEARADDWREMFQINVLAVIELTQKVLPAMIKRQSGDIVNIGSVAGYQTYAGGSVYSATKFCLRALTEAWRKDLLGTGTRVIGIHPGMVETEFSEVRFRGDRLKAKEVYKGFDALSGKDVADAIVWSLSCPRHVNVESLLLMPTAQAAVGQVAKDT